MVKIIESPSMIYSSGNKQKIIKEYIGFVNTNNKNISIAHMISPKGWKEIGQKPKFDEYTIVLKGQLNVENDNGEIFHIKEGQAIITYANDWIRYSTPAMETEYIAVCCPAFSIDLVNRDK